MWESSCDSHSKTSTSIGVIACKPCQCRVRLSTARLIVLMCHRWHFSIEIWFNSCARQMNSSVNVHHVFILSSRVSQVDRWLLWCFGPFRGNCCILASTQNQLSTKCSSPRSAVSLLTVFHLSFQFSKHLLRSTFSIPVNYGACTNNPIKLFKINYI